VGVNPGLGWDPFVQPKEEYEVRGKGALEVVNTHSYGNMHEPLQFDFDAKGNVRSMRYACYRYRTEKDYVTFIKRLTPRKLTRT
jgi:hypothetical protein